MNFSEALERIKKGDKLTRTGWRTYGAVIYLDYFNRTSRIQLRTKSGGVSWMGNSDDLLAEDWEVQNELNTSER